MQDSIARLHRMLAFSQLNDEERSRTEAALQYLKQSVKTHIANFYWDLKQRSMTEDDILPEGRTMKIKLGFLKHLIRESVVGPNDFATLMQRTQALNLTALPRRHPDGYDEINIVGSNYRKTVRSLLQWARALDQIESRMKRGEKLTHAGWGTKDDEQAGLMVPLDRVEGHHG